MVFSLMKTLDPQDDVLRAAKDISSILAAEHSSKKRVKHPNEMAALALTLNPVRILLSPTFLTVCIGSHLTFFTFFHAGHCNERFQEASSRASLQHCGADLSITDVDLIGLWVLVSTDDILWRGPLF